MVFTFKIVADGTVPIDQINLLLHSVGLAMGYTCSVQIDPFSSITNTGSNVCFLETREFNFSIDMDTLRLLRTM